MDLGMACGIDLMIHTTIVPHRGNHLFDPLLSVRGMRCSEQAIAGGGVSGEGTYERYRQLL